MEKASPKSRKKAEESSSVLKKKFLNADCKKRWKNIYESGIIVEKVIDDSAIEKCSSTEFLTEKGLIKLAIFAKNYSPSLVKEFFGNLSLAIKTPITRGYQ